MPRKLVLKKPIKLGESDTITELVFREEVCAGDLRGIPVGHIGPAMLVEELLKVAGRLCAQPDPVMSKLGIDDLGEVGDLVVGFFRGGPATGTTPSP